MRKIPTPKSLGLTKTTCSDIYASAINRGGKVWFEVDHDGKTWYSNGHISIDRLPKFKGYANIAEFVGVPEKRMDLDKAINNSDTKGELRQLAYGREFMSGGRPVVALVGEDGGTFSTVQTHYFELVKWMYPNATIEATSPTTIHYVKVDGKLVAIIMPCRI